MSASKFKKCKNTVDFVQYTKAMGRRIASHKDIRFLINSGIETSSVPQGGDTTKENKFILPSIAPKSIIHKNKNKLNNRLIYAVLLRIF